MSNELKEKILLWGYRIFSYIVPGGFALWTFVIEKLIDNNVSLATKMGVSGMFMLALMVIIAVYFVGRHFRNKITKLNNKILEELDNDKKAILIAKKRKIESMQEIYHNAIFIAPFLGMFLLVLMVEKQMVSIRGILGFVCISMAIGMGFNGVKQWLHSKGVTKD